MIMDEEDDVSSPYRLFLQRNFGIGSSSNLSGNDDLLEHDEEERVLGSDQLSNRNGKKLERAWFVFPLLCLNLRNFMMF
jgi:hypothetical protein